MYKKIYTIILGNNESLFGAINDAKIIYNIFYNFYINKKEWEKPYILLNENITIKNICNIVNNFNNPEIILIYFSGHSNKHGKIKFYKSYISNIDILKNINNYIKNKSECYFIIDSCYSEKFTYNNNFESLTNINNIYFLVSSQSNQTSKEFIVKYNPELFTFSPIKEKTKIPISIFTYYLSTYLKEITYIKDIENNIINKNIWIIINKKYNQLIFFKKYNLMYIDGIK